MSKAPDYLVLKFPAGTDDRQLQRWSDAIAAARGLVLAAGTAYRVSALEQGSAHDALLIARFAFAEDLAGFWETRPAEDCAGLVALAAEGLAWEGWPGSEIPTIAGVIVPDHGFPPAYMLIEGTGHDEAAMDRYRAIIMPMLRERGAWYPLFAFGDAIRVLAGAWEEAFLALSRWPSRALAEDFWWSERYQQQAIPERRGTSRFDVQLLNGIAG